MYAVRIHQTGGPEVLAYEQVETPKPGPGQVLVKVEAAGVNFIDTYHRSGLYQLQLPVTLGREAAGIVQEVGIGVSGFQTGQRVAFCEAQGAYAEYTVVPANLLIPVPDGTSLEQAAAALLQGMTAHYLTHSAYPIQPGDTILIHAAAGGTGALVVQMAKMRGARVFGTVSTEEKAALAREAGADEVIMYTQTAFDEEARRLTGGTGVHVVYDSVGKTTFEQSLNSLRRRGYLVLFGQSSGPVPPFNPSILNTKGSLFLTRPTLRDYVAEHAELLQRAGDVFNWIASGKLKLRIDRVLPLSDAVEAHRLLESRATAGKLLLQP